jgi:hypothetical protein
MLARARVRKADYEPEKVKTLLSQVSQSSLLLFGRSNTLLKQQLREH